jgi:hypothetical protein
MIVAWTETWVLWSKTEPGLLMKTKMKMPPNELMCSGLDSTLLRRAFEHTVSCSTKATVLSQAAMSLNSDEVSLRLEDV